MFSVSTAAYGLLFAGVTQALSSGSGPVKGTVQWDLERRDVSSDLSKRAALSLGDFKSAASRGGYFASAAVGTPGQTVTLQLDTGSSDTWILYSQASQCVNSTAACSFGSFNPSNSSSFQEVGRNQFKISYSDGTSASGDYIVDSLAIGGITADNLTMGLAITTDKTYGVAGIGYALDEVLVTEASSTAVYPNLPVLMVNEGHIKSNAYSMWLSSIASSNGSILFGGVDTSKYSGALTSLDVVKNSATGQYSGFVVPMTSAMASSSSGSDVLYPSIFPINVLLDSGSTVSYLPTNLTTQIWKDAGAVYSTDVNAALIPCRFKNSTGNFTLGFGGGGALPASINITIPMSELVTDLDDGSAAPSFNSGMYNGQPACRFGISNGTASSSSSSSDGSYILGDSFLRSAYVVYDLENNKIALAQRNFNATGASQVVAFESKGAAIPSATAAAAYSTVAAPTGSATASSTADATYNAQSGFVPSSASRGVVGGGALGIVLMVMGALLL